MPVGTGLSAQVAVAEETVYGTIVPPTRGIEFNTEGIQASVGKVYGKALRNSRLQRADRTRTFVQGAAGQVDLDLLTEGMGLLLKYALGGVATSQPDVATKPTEYLHSFTPSDSGLLGHSLTVQVGRPAVGGTTIPFTYAGCKITDWTLSVKEGDAGILSLTFDAKSEDLATVLAASPTYPTGAAMLSFIDASLTVDGVDTYVTAATIQGKNSLKTDRRGLGNIKKEPVANGEVEITGSFDADFESTAKHISFMNGTTAALVLTFSYGEIDAGQANPFMLKVTIPAVEYTGDPPTVKDMGVVPHNLKFKALFDGTNPIITIDYHTSDVTP